MANQEVVVTTDTQDLLGLSAEAADAILSNCQVQIQLVDPAAAAHAVQTDDNSK
ncbi:TPA: hypothetical protein SL629_006685 [Pseudomonas aeruginosa]|jgi:hypothetical protein|uniref:hypothetical protein n=1 Tax=Pseudomonadaceae TaxID=135621 RepID=UPI001374A120|nr:MULTISPECIES: hypothetical protein [Pseudomonadaceae]MBA1264932.1 hypothetical protein [Stutzerimonas stutzeri]HEJ4911958.1 hypothetical protein [Pseudomonas aeruginosa]